MKAAFVKATCDPDGNNLDAGNISVSIGCRQLALSVPPLGERFGHTTRTKRYPEFVRQ